MVPSHPTRSAKTASESRSQRESVAVWLPRASLKLLGIFNAIAHVPSYSSEIILWWLTPNNSLRTICGGRSVVAQNHHRINSRGAARRNVGGSQAGCYNQRSDGYVRKWI